MGTFVDGYVPSTTKKKVKNPVTKMLDPKPRPLKIVSPWRRDITGRVVGLNLLPDEKMRKIQNEVWGRKYTQGGVDNYGFPMDSYHTPVYYSEINRSINGKLVEGRPIGHEEHNSKEYQEREHLINSKKAKTGDFEVYDPANRRKRKK